MVETQSITTQAPFATPTIILPSITPTIHPTALDVMLTACNDAVKAGNGQIARIQFGDQPNQFASIQSLVYPKSDGIIDPDLHPCLWGHHGSLKIGDKTWDPKIAALWDYISVKYPRAVGETPDQTVDTTSIYPNGLILFVGTDALIIGGRYIQNSSVPYIVPADGENMWYWGYTGMQVWVSDQPLTRCNAAGTDFTCGKHNAPLMLWNSSTNAWKLAGQFKIGPMRTVTIDFDQAYKNIAITGSYTQWAVDYVAGLLADGRKVPFGYTYDDRGSLVPGMPFWDGNSPMRGLYWILEQEKLRIAPASIMDCSIIGKTPDKNYLVIYPSDQDPEPPFQSVKNMILFRLQQSPTDTGGHRGDNAWPLIGIEITYGIAPAGAKTCDG